MSEAEVESQAKPPDPDDPSYRYTRLYPGTLSNGRPVAFDDEVQLSEEDAQDEYNTALVDGGVLLPISQDTGAQATQESADDEDEPEPEAQEQDDEQEEEPPTDEPQEEQQ